MSEDKWRQFYESAHQARSGPLVMDMGHGVLNCGYCYQAVGAISRKVNGMGVSDNLKDVAKSAVAQELIRGLDKAVETAQKAVDKATADLAEATSVRDAIKKALGPIKRGILYYMPSRTGAKVGHFLERFLDGGGTKCSCLASRFGAKCWAIKYLDAQGDNAYTKDYRYAQGDYTNFDARVVPYRYGAASKAPANNYLY